MLVQPNNQCLFVFLADLFLQGRISSAPPGWTWWESYSWCPWLPGTSWPARLILTARPKKNQASPLETTDWRMHFLRSQYTDVCRCGCGLHSQTGFGFSFFLLQPAPVLVFASIKIRLNYSKSHTQPQSYKYLINILNFLYSKLKLKQNYQDKYIKSKK